MDFDSRIPPQAVEAEQSVIGSILLESDIYEDIAGIMTAEEFYQERHKEIFSAIEELHRKESAIDIITVQDLLKSRNTLEKIGGIEYLSDIASSVPTTANAKHYARLIHDKWIRRSLIKASTNIIETCYSQAEEIENIIQKAESDILQVNETKETTMQHASAVLASTFNDLEKRYNNKGKLTGLYTGFKDLDYKLGGLQGGDLIIIAGRPSMGKTSLAENIATYNACKGVPTAFFSMEMSKEKIMNRIISQLGMVDNQKLRLGMLEDEDWDSIAKTTSIISESKLEIDDTPNLKPVQIRSRCRRLKKKYGSLGLIVIDHLTEMWRPRKSNNDASEYSENIRSTKRLAKEMNCPVILLQQLNRNAESKTDKRPLLSDLRETGVAEEVADVVMMIYRDDYYNPDTDKKNIAEIIINKGRDCGVGTVELAWLPKYTKFANLDKYKKLWF